MRPPLRSSSCDKYFLHVKCYIYVYTKKDYTFQQWGNVSVENDKNPQIDEFLEHLEMFITNLLSAVDNMEGQVTLAENGVGPQIDGLSSPTDYQAAGRFLFIIITIFSWTCEDKLFKYIVQ